MAGTVNKVIVVGRLGKDPEMRYAASGAAIATLSLATNFSQRDEQGQWQEQTEWHRVVLFNKTAETAGQYLRKGSLAYVEGRLQTRKWQDQSGQDRYTTEIVGNMMTMLGGREDGGFAAQDNSFAANPAPAPAASPAAAPATQPQSAPPASDFDDDIPF